MTEASIRSASSADIPTITAIYAQAVLHGTASYELEPPSEQEMLRRFKDITGAGMPYIAAEIGGELAGYAYFGPFRPRPAYRFMVEDSIYIDSRFQGKGVGRLLLRKLIDDGQALGFRQMVAVIGDGQGNRASVRLHQSLGFRHSGTLIGSGFKHGRWLDTVFMQIALNGGTGTLPEGAD